MIFSDKRTGSADPISPNAPSRFNPARDFGRLNCNSFSRLKFCQEPARRIVHAFNLSPVLSFVPLHARNKSWSAQHDAQRNPASGA